MAVAAFGVRALKTPVRTPQANAVCERLIGTIRRECLDFMIPLNERHLRAILREWVFQGAHTLAWGQGFRIGERCLLGENIAIAWKLQNELLQQRF